MALHEAPPQLMISHPAYYSTIDLECPDSKLHESHGRDKYTPHRQYGLCGVRTAVYVAVALFFVLKYSFSEPRSAGLYSTIGVPHVKVQPPVMTTQWRTRCRSTGCRDQPLGGPLTISANDGKSPLDEVSHMFSDQAKQLGAWQQQVLLEHGLANLKAVGRTVGDGMSSMGQQMFDVAAQGAAALSSVVGKNAAKLEEKVWVGVWECAGACVALSVWGLFPECRGFMIESFLEVVQTARGMWLNPRPFCSTVKQFMAANVACSNCERRIQCTMWGSIRAACGTQQCPCLWQMADGQTIVSEWHLVRGCSPTPK